jgi:hypothetical protein
MSDMNCDEVRRHARIVDGNVGEQTAQQQRRPFLQATWKRHQLLIRPLNIMKTLCSFLVVVAAIALVHVSSGHSEDAEENPKLPPHVADLRDVILSAARSGNIDELKSAFEVSGSVPDLGISPRSDPIKTLKDRSADRNGRDTLAALVEILEMSPAALPLGNDIENNLVYVWPYVSTRPLDKLTPSEEVDLYRLVTPAEATEMRAKKRWLWWQLAIAADGTWMLFKKAN